MRQVSQRVFGEAGALPDAVGSAAVDPVGFARLAVRELPRLVASELTTLSVCDLTTGRRKVVSHPDAALSSADIAAFDRHFFAHPLVRFHSTHPAGGTHRISDSVSPRAFHRGELYNDYYRRIGIDHAVAIPLYVDGALLVSFVLNRTGRDFSDDEVAFCERLRGLLSAMYRNAVTLHRAATMLGRLAPEARVRLYAADAAEDDAQGARPSLLTAREREVLRWVASGKSDRQIGTILGVSPRTVQKHLEHAYVKLGVENRTAAAMRLRAPDSNVKPLP